MNAAKISAITLGICLITVGCSSPNHYLLNSQVEEMQESTYSQGQESIVSRKRTTVACQIFGNELRAGTSWRVAVSVTNTSSTAFDFGEMDVDLIAVVGEQEKPIRVLSYQDFVSSRSSARGSQIMGDAFTSMSLGATSDGSAKAELEMERTRQRQQASRDRAQEMDRMEAEVYLRRTTVPPGRTYGGIVDFQRVSSKAGPIDWIYVRVNAGTETHEFKYRVRQ